mgnify:CR=1 FL=1
MSEVRKVDLVKKFVEIAKELEEKKAQSVVIWVDWVRDEAIDVDYEFNKGVCECGEWAEYCRACYDSAYEDGKRDGKVEAERWW